jgi:hypothetical protein
MKKLKFRTIIKLALLFLAISNISFAQKAGQQLKVGDKLNGGDVIYVDATGMAGLIADTIDLGKMPLKYARKLCRQKGRKWHLPNKDEMDLMYSHRDIVGGFVEKYYWTATEINAGGFWTKEFSDKGFYITDQPENPNWVRAVRKVKLRKKGRE